MALNRIWMLALLPILPILLMGPLANELAAQSQQEPAYVCSSRVHLQKGTNRGYLVVQVKMKEGLTLYSLKPKPKKTGTDPKPKVEIPNTEIKVSKTVMLKSLGDFQPDTPPKEVVDPYLGKLKKHAGTVQFFAPIELAPGVAAKQLELKVSVSGQVCSDASCLPMNKKLVAKFKSYFEKKATAQRSPLSDPTRK